MDPARKLDPAEPEENSVDVEVETDDFELGPRPDPLSELAPGVLISDQLRLVGLFGAGAMGSVWLADHIGLDTHVAVKFMSSEVSGDQACVARFAAEARLAARIRSPHVVNILDYATTSTGIPYIVMELLEGEDLEMRIRGGRALRLEESSRILVQLCKALTSAHELGIVHRDIKPDNLFLVRRDGDIFVKVLDFGIAKDEGRLKRITVTGTTMGTPAYMSPEQLFRPAEVDPRSDLWSAAVVAYRCLTGRLPFDDADGFGSMCISVHDGTFAAPRSIVPRLPPELDAWFAKALCVDPRMRFQSATEMADAYLAVLERARLLPDWAMHRSSIRERPHYSTDPGDLRGGPIGAPRPRRTARRAYGPRRTVHRALVLGVLVAVFCTLAATPREAFVAIAEGDTPFPDLPILSPTPDEPAVVFYAAPRFRAPPSRPATAPRDVARPEAVPLPPRRRGFNTPDRAQPEGAIEKPAPIPLAPAAVFGI